MRRSPRNRARPRSRDLRATIDGRAADACSAIGDYIETAERLEAVRTVALATSAVRDASNGDAFLAELRERFSLQGRIIDGSEEAQLTYRGALSERRPDGKSLVIDIGGGSTELIVGSGPDPSFHASLQVGVVRHSERHLRSDPPRSDELEALAEDVGAALEAELVSNPGLSADTAIAVAGTPASLAAIELGLEEFDGRGGRRPSPLRSPYIPADLLAPGGARARRAPGDRRPSPRPGADDRRRRRDPDQGDAHLRPCRRSSSPSETSSTGPRLRVPRPRWRRKKGRRG